MPYSRRCVTDVCLHSLTFVFVCMCVCVKKVRVSVFVPFSENVQVGKPTVLVCQLM